MVALARIALLVALEGDATRLLRYGGYWYNRRPSPEFMLRYRRLALHRAIDAGRLVVGWPG